VRLPSAQSVPSKAMRGIASSRILPDQKASSEKRRGRRMSTISAPDARQRATSSASSASSWCRPLTSCSPRSAARSSSSRSSLGNTPPSVATPITQARGGGAARATASGSDGEIGIERLRPSSSSPASAPAQAGSTTPTTSKRREPCTRPCAVFAQLSAKWPFASTTAGTGADDDRGPGIAPGAFTSAVSGNAHPPLSPTATLPESSPRSSGAAARPGRSPPDAIVGPSPDRTGAGPAKSTPFPATPSRSPDPRGPLRPPSASSW
jgi:hypothetical protein